MIVVYQEDGRYESPKNFVMPTVTLNSFENETEYLLYLQNVVREHCWDIAHNDTKYSYKYDIDQYPLPTIVNIIKEML